MIRFETLTSKVIPLTQSNIDTDQIIPAQHVNAVGEAALRKALFANRCAGEADFVLNDPRMAGRSILLTGSNFGCGSSREAAAWALHAYGIRALLGTTFNETFANNCLQNGLLAVPLGEADHAAIAASVAAQPDIEILVDLLGNVIRLGTASFSFAVDPFARDLLLHGHDELGYLLSRTWQIRAYEMRLEDFGAAS